MARLARSWATVKRHPTTYEAFLSTIHPNDVNMVNNAYQNAVKNKIPYEITHRIITPAGEIKHVHERSSEIRDRSGKTIRSIGTIHFPAGIHGFSSQFGSMSAGEGIIF